MTPLDILGHIAYLWIITGMLMIAGKYPLGWLIRLVGEFLWVIIGILMGMSSIWIWGIVFMIIDVYGFWKWRKNEKSVEKSKRPQPPESRGGDDH